MPLDMTILLEGVGGSALPLLGGDGGVPYAHGDGPV